MTAFKISFCNFFKEYNDLFYPSPADSASPPLALDHFRPWKSLQNGLHPETLAAQGFPGAKRQRLSPLSPSLSGCSLSQSLKK